MPIDRTGQQDHFRYREFRVTGRKAIEIPVYGSLYRRVRILRLTHLVVDRMRFPVDGFYPCCLFPEEWPPALIDDFLRHQDNRQCSSFD